MKISASSYWFWKKLVLLQLQQPEFDLLLSFFFYCKQQQKQGCAKKRKKKERSFNQTKPKKAKNKIGKSEAGYYFQTKQKDTKQDESFAPRDHRALNRHCTVALQACQLEREC
jgi:hypothetical protein